MILAIGDELALGQTIDRNSGELAARLASMGVMAGEHHTVADDRQAIAEAFARAASKSDLLIVTGGLGPTEDDLTRFALADAMGTDVLEPDETALQSIREFFESRSRPMPTKNQVQAMIPRGAAAIANHHGTAPGIEATIGNCRVFVMPGVPREMRHMFDDAVRPAVHAMTGQSQRTIVTTKINTFGQGESTIAHTLGEIMDRNANPLIGTTVSQGVVSIRIRSDFADAEQATRELEDAAARVEHVLGPIVYSRDEVSLAQVLVQDMASRGRTLALAESCTGGLVAAMITDVPGASDVLQAGYVTYSNESKVRDLGVDEKTLAEHGAVSAPVARLMAIGASQRAGTDEALAITGIAGPGGGSDQKPVGTVYLAHACHDQPAASNRGEPTCAVFVLNLSGDRAVIRDRSAKCALQRVRLRLHNHDSGLIQWMQPCS